MTKFNVITTEKWLNALGIIGLIVLLSLALFFQFYYSELPCPLCLLQRVGFIIISTGFLLNLRFGFRPSHYALSLLGAIFTSFVALRQVALHVIPGTGSYGSAVFGLHLYTWSFILSMLIVLGTALLLGVDRQYTQTKAEVQQTRKLAGILFALMMLVTLINIIYTFKECGLKQCPDNPTTYIM